MGGQQKRVPVTPKQQRAPADRAQRAEEPDIVASGAELTETGNMATDGLGQVVAAGTVDADEAIPALHDPPPGSPELPAQLETSSAAPEGPTGSEPIAARFNSDTVVTANEPAFPPTAKPHTSPRRFRRALPVLGVVTVLAWTAAAFAAGIAVGTRQRIEPPAPPADVVIDVEEIALPDTAPDVESVAVDDVPVVANVLGLDAATARNVLADNATGVTVNVVERPGAGDAGFVIDQDPPPGTESPATVTITVTAPAPMPDLVGATRRDAVEQLETLGARVVVVEEYRKGVAAGEVLAVEPADGPVPNEVTVAVAAPAASAQLTSLDRVDADCSISDVNSNGTAYVDEITCGIPRVEGTPRTISYDLSRDVDLLTFAVGLTDTSDLSDVAQLTVTLDGAEAYTGTVRFGELTPVELDTTDVLRVAFTVSGFNDDSAGRGVVAIVDARINGSASAIDALTTDQ